MGTTKKQSSKRTAKKTSAKKTSAKKTSAKKTTAASVRRALAAASPHFDVVRAIGLALPGVEESTSYGTPALKVKGKMMVRLREDGVTLVVVVEPGARDILMEARPKTYFITDHYAPYPQLMLVDLASVPRGELRRLIEDAYASM